MFKSYMSRWLLSFGFFLIYSVSADATGILPTDFSSKISMVDVRSNGNFLIGFTGSISGATSCRSHSQWMTGNANTAGGKIILSSALAAWAKGSSVWAQGTGTCNEFSGYESDVLMQLK